MAPREPAVALSEADISICIPGTSLCSLLCPHPALANIGVDEHSAVPWWLRDGPGGVFEELLLTKAGQNDNSGANQEQSLVCGELVSEVPVCPGHSGSMPPLMWPPLLSELVDRAKNGVFPGGILEFGYPGLAEGNVIDSHIQFDFPRSS